MSDRVDAIFKERETHRLACDPIYVQAVDESRRQKLVRFRCDLPRPPWRVRGVLGSYCVDPSDIPESEEDYARFSARRMDAFLLRFCTPLASKRQPSAPDLLLKEHIIGHTKVLSADGAASERRSLFLAARELFDSAVWVLRDPAHAVRIAVKTPLHSDEVFQQVWNECFGDKDALVPSIQNSGKWRALLEALQRDIFSIPAMSHDQALKDVVLKSFAFAKHRFDSVASPQVPIFFDVRISQLLGFI